MKNLWVRLFLNFILFIFSSKAIADDCGPAYAILATMQSKCGSSLEGTFGCPGHTYDIGTMIYSYEPSGFLDIYCYRKSCVVPNYGITSETEGLSPACASGNLLSKAVAQRLIRPINQCGSVIQTENRVVGESIPVTGAPFSLSYFTSWAKGRAAEYKSISTITTATVRPNVTGYELWVYNEVGTQVDHRTFGITPNQNYTYTWNGLNSAGVETWGRVAYSVKVQEKATDFSPVITTTVYLGSLKSKKLGLGLWVPDIWHFYDPGSQTVFNGDGSQRNVTATTIAGGGYRLPEQDGSLVYNFDSTGRITSTLTGITGTAIYTFAYDSAGHLSSIAQPFGRITRFNYTSGLLSSITAPTGEITTVTTNGNGQLATVKAPNGETFSLTYANADGLITAFTNPHNNTTTMTYDADGNLITDKHSDGYSVTLGNLNGNLTSTSAMGLKTSETISGGAGDLISSLQTQTLPDGSIYKVESDNSVFRRTFRGFDQTLVYNSIDPRFGNQALALAFSSNLYRTINYSDTVNLSNSADPFSIVDWTNKTTVGTGTITSVYTGSSHSLVSTTQLGATHKTVFDTYQRPVSDQVGSQTPTTFTYTSELLTKVQQGVRATSLGYQSGTHRLSSVTNPLGQKTSFAYDSAGRLSSQTLPDARVISYNYDFQGNLLSITPPSRPVHSFLLGTNELVSTYQPPNLIAGTNYNTTYSYNLDKKLTKISRPDGQTINLSYNATTGQLNTVTGSFGTYTQTYGSDLNPLRTTGPNGSYVERTYSNSLLNAILTYCNASTYCGDYGIYLDSAGHVSMDTIANGIANGFITYSYDAAEHLIGTGDITLSYDVPDGKLTGTALGTLTDSYAYNSFGEVTGYQAKKSGVVFYSYTLTRDNLGRITRKVELLNGITSTFDYTYDTAGRLTKVMKNSVVSSTYNYDTNGNRSGGIINGTTTNGVYDNQDRLTTFNNFSYTYSLNGDLLTKKDNTLSQTTSYTYDVFGNLTKVILPTKTVKYDIDPLQRRLGKTVGSTLQGRYIHDFQNRLIGELDPASAFKRRYVYASKTQVPDYFIDAAGEKYRIFSDYLGSVRVVMKLSTGTAVQIMEHDEFGRVVRDTSPGFQPLGFAGGEYDADTGLVRFMARDYDPYIGRWLSKDPILFDGGDSNLYGYAANDPVNFIDPMGLWRWPGAIYDDAMRDARNSGLPGPHNGQQDAYRHCVASCMMTQENGSFLAQLLGDANEKRGDWMHNQESGEKCMDQNNNSKGRDFGRGGGNCSQQCAAAAGNGGLTTYTSGSTPGYWGY